MLAQRIATTAATTAPTPRSGERVRAGGRAWHGSRWLRTILTSLFVLLMLGSAHLFMVAVNAGEHAVARPDPAAGVPARLFTDLSLVDELAAAGARTHDPAERRVIAAGLAAAEAGTLEVRTLPVTRFLVYAALGMSALGLLLIWITSRIRSDAAQSILGIFGGNLIWTGAVEYGFTLASRSLGIGKTVAVVDGQLVASYGEYVLLKHSWGGLLLILAYLLFLESSRCPVFLWWRERTPTMRGPIATGRIDNYGPRSAFQYATTVWFFYLLLLWTYDEQVAGVYSLTTKSILFAAIAGSIYCTWKLHQQAGWGPAIRYAVGAMIVVWTPIEILGKWGVMRQPWLLLEPTTFAVFFGGLGLGTWALWRAARRRRVGAPGDADAVHSELAVA
ncbi:MAG: hypothetical protein IPH07_27030 [Deltaproteobacteria bacterium]|nr:hypothetical protein [Deltaproteobacteria bacterium]MBK8240297.1 hypothetical protein [Deltaproteobacteria bacterium]MBK8718414.1 hypothetical protein [Deltaproteobacteria bacterium]MBP7291561.1 hypothetical protein [Nannocystaceae bacterium]